MDRPGEEDWGPDQLLRQYLLGHATAVCDGTCLLCVDTRAYLERDGGAIVELDGLLRRRSTSAPVPEAPRRSRFAPTRISDRPFQLDPKLLSLDDYGRHRLAQSRTEEGEDASLRGFFWGVLGVMVVMTALSDAGQALATSVLRHALSLVHGGPG